MKELTKLELVAYDDDDKWVFSRYTTIQELAKGVPDFDKYYYRLGLFRFAGYKTNRCRQTVNYFGVELSSDREMNMTLQGLIEYDLNSYIAKFRGKNKGKRKPDPEDYLGMLLYEMARYSAVMNKINQSMPVDVENAIKVFKGIDDRTRKITNLNDVKGASGIYMLIFDAYNACYVGQSKDMKARILKHWSCGNGKKADMFRALDTTRIYTLTLNSDEYNEKVDATEYYLTKAIPSYVLVNAIAGGKPDWQEATGLYK